MNPLMSVLGPALGIVGDWFEGRRRLAQARVESEVAIETARATADIDWDNIQAQNARSSWADEWFTILLSVPFIAAFFGPLQDDVARGFEVISTSVPDWYIAAFALAISAAFGYREFVRPFMNRLTGATPQGTSTNDQTTPRRSG